MVVRLWSRALITALGLIVGCGAAGSSHDLDAGSADEDGGPGRPPLVRTGCGDGLLATGEACDDANRASGDGCSERCAIEDGWTCPVVGAGCRAARCGDGVVAGYEECDSGDLEPGDGCDDRCSLEKGWACDAEGCRRTTCGDGKTEGLEQCDDGPDDVPYDGCYACVREPSCSEEGCSSACGDGIRFPNEECDDGNVRSGDGCSARCRLEEGFACTHKRRSRAKSVRLPVIYRDVRGYDLPAIPEEGLAAGHPDFEHVNEVERGLVKARLSADKKPALAKKKPLTVASAASFATWYRDDPAFNRTIVDTLQLDQDASGAYVFRDESFFPLDERGFAGEGLEPLRWGAADEAGNRDHNYHFTSELRTWFQYQGGEFLEFEGDDDVWVFINDRLAVDLGGVHAAQVGNVTLDPSGMDERFGLERGNIYEMALFQAERHRSRSVYQLTLHDFERARTRCEPICGDGIVTRNEACDDGTNSGGYGRCAAGCVHGPRCGDGKVQKNHGEQCDDANRDDTDGCRNDCQLPGDASPS